MIPPTGSDDQSLTEHRDTVIAALDLVFTGI